MGLALQLLLWVVLRGLTMITVLPLWSSLFFLPKAKKGTGITDLEVEEELWRD